MEADATLDATTATHGRCTWLLSFQRPDVIHEPSSLDVMKLRKLITEERYQRRAKLLEGVAAMLTKMI